MTHTPIIIRDLGLSFIQHHCFDGFTTQISFGSKIGIIGQNGSGKSSLLKMMINQISPTSGMIEIPDSVKLGYLPQVIHEHEKMSGGERLNKVLSSVLSSQPNVLLLDEPTNHLDKKNRKSILQLLQHFYGTVILVSHDEALLNQVADTIWDIHQGKVHCFNGSYENYQKEVKIKKEQLENQKADLKKQQHQLAEGLMKEQKRAAQSRKKGKKNISNRKWPTVVSHAKAGRAEKTSGVKQAGINEKRHQIEMALSEVFIPPVIEPTFHLSHKKAHREVLVSIREGQVGYHHEAAILKNITLTVGSKARWVISGGNGSGKSTLVKAIMRDKHVTTQGEWLLPQREEIGYLDQHYTNLKPKTKTVFDCLSHHQPIWSDTEVRHHLNTFLFRSNQEVDKPLSVLSGGEMARLSLAMIAAKPPSLLILDELCNNLDIVTKNHVVEVLNYFEGAMIVISHDETFLKRLGIEHECTVECFS